MSTNEQYLTQKVRQLNRLRNQDIVRTIAAAPGTFNTIQREGPTAGHAYAQSWMPQRSPGIDPLELAERKADILDKLAELEKNKDANRAGIAKEWVGKNNKMELIKTAVEEAGRLVRGDQEANKALQVVRTQALSAMRQKEMALLEQISGQAGGTAARNYAQFLESFADPNNGIIEDDLISSAGFWKTWSEQANAAMASGDPSEIAAAMNAGNMLLHQSAGVTLTEIGTATTAGEGPVYINPDTGEPVGVAVTMDPELEARLPVGMAPVIQKLIGVQEMAVGQENLKNQIIQSEGSRIADDFGKEIAQGLRGADLGKFANIVEVIMSFGDEGGATPEDLSQAIDALAAPEGQDPAALQKLHDALAELDELGNMKSMPVTARQARDELFADPQFLKFMEDNGFSDPKMALRALRERARQKLVAGKAEGRAKLQQIRDGSMSPTFGEAAREEGAASPTVQPGAAGGRPIPTDEEISALPEAPDQPKQGGIIGKLRPRKPAPMAPAQPEQSLAMQSNTVQPFNDRAMQKRIAKVAARKPT